MYNNHILRLQIRNFDLLANHWSFIIEFCVIYLLHFPHYRVNFHKKQWYLKIDLRPCVNTDLSPHCQPVNFRIISFIYLYKRGKTILVCCFGQELSMEYFILLDYRFNSTHSTQTHIAEAQHEGLTILCKVFLWFLTRI